MFDILKPVMFSVSKNDTESKNGNPAVALRNIPTKRIVIGGVVALLLVILVVYWYRNYRPINATSVTNTVNNYLDRDEYTQAIKLIDSQPKSYKNSSVALLELANIYFDEQKYAKALSYYKAYSSHNTLTEAMDVDLAQSAASLKNNSLAIYYYQQAIKIENSDNGGPQSGAYIGLYQSQISSLKQGQQ